MCLHNPIKICFPPLQDTKTAAADIILFKGVLQIPLFALIIWLGQRQRKRRALSGGGTDDEDEAAPAEKSLDFLPGSLVEKIGCFSYAFFGGVRYACLYSAVLFIPMADFIVICATTPIFSYLFSRLFLKSKLTVIKVCLKTRSCHSSGMSVFSPHRDTLILNQFRWV